MGVSGGHVQTLTEIKKDMTFETETGRHKFTWTQSFKTQGYCSTHWQIARKLGRTSAESVNTTPPNDLFSRCKSVHKKWLQG